MVYAIEGADSSHGYWGGATKASAVFGNTLGLGVAAALRYALSDEQLRSYGWRIPFAIGACIGAFGVKARSRLMARMEEEKKATALLQVVDTGTARADRERRDKMNPVPIASATMVLPSAPRASTSNTWLTVSSVDDDIEEHVYHKDEGGEEDGGRSKAETSPCCFVVNDYIVELVASFGFISFWCLSYYTIFVWNLYFLTSEDLIGDAVMSKRDAWLIVFVNNLFVPLLLPLSGHLGDTVQAWHYHRTANDVNRETVAQELSNRVWGYTVVMRGAAGLMLLTCVGAYQLLLGGAVNWSLVAAGQAILTLCTALYGGNMAVVLVELFPIPVRYTGMGVSYNMCNALVSGTATIAQSYLVMTDGLHSNAPWLTDISGKYLWCSPFQALFADQRLHAAFYLQCVSVLAIFSLSVGITSCSHRSLRRKLESDVREKEKSSVASSGTTSGERGITHLTQIYIQRG